MGPRVRIKYGTSVRVSMAVLGTDLVGVVARGASAVTWSW